MPATTTQVSTELSYKGLLDRHRDSMVERLVSVHHFPRFAAEPMIDHLWDRWVNRLETDFPHMGVDKPLAERIMNEALGYWQLCAFESGYGPSPLVDLGVHTGLLYTPEIEVFFFALCGRFIHHCPTDVPGLHDQTSSRKCEGKCDNWKCDNEILDTGAKGSGFPATSAAGHTGYLSDQRQARSRQADCSDCNTCSYTRAEYPDGDCSSPDNQRVDRHPRTIADTVAAMRLLGPVDDELWLGKGRANGPDDPPPPPCAICIGISPRGQANGPDPDPDPDPDPPCTPLPRPFCTDWAARSQPLVGSPMA